VLTLLEEAIDRIRRGETLPEGFDVWTLDFIRNFADGCHHAKEEDVLFPLLELRGIPRQGGPIGCMLHEHDLGRQCVAKMSAAISAGNPEAFADAAESYVTLLRQHIFKEDHVLFHMADMFLTPEDDAGAVARFKNTEIEPARRGQHARFLADVDRWECVFATLPELAV
jgi:hemerythrin-like domain-containing protein